VNRQAFNLRHAEAPLCEHTLNINAKDVYALYILLVLLFAGLALTFSATMFLHGLALLGSATVASCIWAFRDHAERRRTHVLTRSICSVDCTEETYKLLIQILGKEKIDYTVRDHYTIDLASPLRGTIELRISVRESYSDTHVDDLRTTAEFYFDLHETKYDAFRNEKPTGTIIRADPKSQKDSEGIERIISAVVESLDLKTD